MPTHRGLMISRKSKLIIVSSSILVALSLLLPAQADRAAWRKANDAGNADYKRGNYPDALKCFEDALKECRSYDESAEDRATTLNGIGLVYDDMNMRGHAQRYYQQSLDVRRKASGENSYTLVPALNNLAASYLAEKRYEEAIATIKKANELIEKEKGPSDPFLSGNLNRMAGAYQGLKRYTDAAGILKRSLEIAKKNFGPESPPVAVIQNNLALVLRFLGKADSADELYRDSLEIRKKALGGDSLEVASSLNTMALNYREQGKFEEAEPLLLRSLSIVRKSKETKPQQLVAALKNLGLVYRELGAPEKAKPLYKEAISLQRKTFGEFDAALIDTYSDMGQMYQELSDYNKAKGCYEQALEVCDKVGFTALDMRVKVLDRLEDTYRQTDDLQGAIKLNEKTRGLIESKTGDVDTRVLARKLNDLAMLYRQQGDLSKAEDFLEQAVAVEQKRSESSPESGTYMANLARLYEQRGKLEEAKKLYQTVIEIRTREDGADSSSVAAALRHYATALRGLNQKAEADDAEKRAAKIEEASE